MAHSRQWKIADDSMRGWESLDGECVSNIVAYVVGLS